MWIAKQLWSKFLSRKTQECQAKSKVEGGGTGGRWGMCPTPAQQSRGSQCTKKNLLPNFNMCWWKKYVSIPVFRLKTIHFVVSQLSIDSPIKSLTHMCGMILLSQWGLIFWNLQTYFLMSSKTKGIKIARSSLYFCPKVGFLYTFLPVLGCHILQAALHRAL